MRRAATGLAIMLAACSAPKEAAVPADNIAAETDQAVKDEAKSLEAAADEAAALVEAEANAEMKATAQPGATPAQ
jgi:hypothetical protein